MTFTVEYNLNGNILVAKVVGELDLQTYLSMRQKVKDMVNQTGAQHILLDLRRVVLHVSFIDIFEAASTHVEVFDRDKKYAIVYSLQTMAQGNVNFGETVARNRGSQFKVFLDIKEAKEWLGIAA
jgi:hypothetical protein